MLTRTRYSSEIETAAARHALPPRLVEAIVLQESAGNTDAFRFEPKFWRRYLAHVPRWNAENPRRVSSSYGLMQIMFVTATERGFTGRPEELFFAEVGIEFGCRQVRWLLDWADGFVAPPERRLRAALAAYNGGTGGNAPVNDLGHQPLLRTNTYASAILTLYGRSTLGEL